ncbi:MAG TPA: hypothetical protein VGI81_20685 [Tepidisphaeraceae bacterium]
MGSAAYEQPLSASQRITDPGILRTTLHGDSVIASARQALPKPQGTTVDE